MTHHLRLVLGGLLAALLVIAGAGVASATPTVRPQECIDLGAAQAKYDKAKDAYAKDKLTVDNLKANVAQLKADKAPEGQVAAAEKELSQALTHNYDLYVAMNSASLALGTAGRLAAGKHCPDGVDTSTSPPPSKTCKDFATTSAAQAAMKADETLAATLDKDGNGKACDRPGEIANSTEPSGGGTTTPTTTTVAPVTVNNTVINVYPTTIYMWNGGRWVVYSDGTAVRCGSGGKDVRSAEDMDGAIESGTPSSTDVVDAAYPEGGVDAGDGSSAGMVLPGLAGLGLVGAAGGAYGLHRRRRIGA